MMDFHHQKIVCVQIMIDGKYQSKFYDINNGILKVTSQTAVLIRFLMDYCKQSHIQYGS